MSKPIRLTPNAGMTGSVTVRLHWLCRQEASEANLAPGPGEHDTLHQPRELHRRFTEAGPQVLRLSTPNIFSTDLDVSLLLLSYQINL